MSEMYRAAFVRLPQMAQLLWYNLAARADERGFLERTTASNIRQRVGAEGSDVRALLSSGFIVSTPDKKIMVVYGENEKPEFVRHEGRWCVRIYPYFAGYGFVGTAVPIVVPLVW